MARTNLDGDFNLRSPGDEAIARFLVDGVPVSELGTAVETVTGNITLDQEDTSVFADATSANLNVTIPLATNVSGKIYRVKKIDSSANTVTLDRSGSDLIDGSSSLIISTQNDSVTIQSDGVSNWWIV